MRKGVLILGLGVLALALFTGGQIGWCKWANAELQEDLVDLAAQAGTNIGLKSPSSDEDLRNAVVRKAAEHGIELEPTQVTVRRNSGERQTTYLAVDYDAKVNMLAGSFKLHFSASNAR